MISGEFEAGSEGQAARRRDAVRTLAPLAGLMAAAGFVLLLAGRHEGELVRAARIDQEVAGR